MQTQLAKPDYDSETSLLARAPAVDDNGVRADAGSHVEAASGSSGTPLPTGLQRKFEGSLGADLSGVRLHTGAASADACESVSAKAYATGNDIHFGAGHYDPSSSAGEQLLAHEVAHTVQQSNGAQRKAQFKLEVSSPGDSAEVEADHAAAAMVSGTTVSSIGSFSMGSLCRAPDDQASAAKIAKEKEAFKRARDAADGAFTNIAIKQGKELDNMKHEAKEPDKPSMESQIVSGLIGMAIGMALPGIGGVIASKLKIELIEAATGLGEVKEKIKGAFEAGAEKAKEASSKKILEKEASPDRKMFINQFFDGMTDTYSDLALEAEAPAYRAGMDALWQRMTGDSIEGQGGNPEGAAQATAQAQAALAALYAGETSARAGARTAAFAQFCEALRHADKSHRTDEADGMLELTIRVGDKGFVNPADAIKLAKIQGVSEDLVAASSGPVSGFKMLTKITAHYRPLDPEATHGVGDERSFSFLVSPSANGYVAYAESPKDDPWLQARSADQLYKELKDTVIHPTKK